MLRVYLVVDENSQVLDGFWTQSDAMDWAEEQPQKTRILWVVPGQMLGPSEAPALKRPPKVAKKVRKLKVQVPEPMPYEPEEEDEPKVGNLLAACVQVGVKTIKTKRTRKLKAKP